MDLAIKIDVFRHVTKVFLNFSNIISLFYTNHHHHHHHHHGWVSVRRFFFNEDCRAGVSVTSIVVNSWSAQSWSPCERWNSSVFSARRNASRGFSDVVDDDRPFQILAAATGKARSPMVLCNVRGTSNDAVDAERSRLRDSVSETRRSSLARYRGAEPFRQWWTWWWWCYFNFYWRRTMCENNPIAGYFIYPWSLCCFGSNFGIPILAIAFQK